MSATIYTEEHEWLRIDDSGLVTVGITDFAQDHLGDLVYVQLPDIGKRIEKGEEAAVIESVKTASEIMMPASGVITEINTILTEEPGKVNADPLGEGWFFKFQATDAAGISGLMDEGGYKVFVAGLG